MSENEKWTVLGPGGFEWSGRVVFFKDDEGGALRQAAASSRLDMEILMRQAGYTAEKEVAPRMVSVRAEDLDALYSVAYRSRHEIPPDMGTRAARLRRALEARP